MAELGTALAVVAFADQCLKWVHSLRVLYYEYANITHC